MKSSSTDELMNNFFEDAEVNLRGASLKAQCGMRNDLRL